MWCSRTIPTSGQLGRAAVALLLVLVLAPPRHASALDPTPSASPSDTPTPTATPTPTLAPTPSPAPTPVADPLCGTTVSGQLTLDHDIQGCRGVAFKLASGALLDCNGNAIVGNGGTYGVLLDTAVGAEVRGCRITGFGRGVRLLGGSSNRVIANEPYANRNYGIELAGASSGNRIEANLVHDSGDEGIHVGAGASGNEIFSNQIIRSARENLYLINCSGNFATGNVLDASGAAAIFVKHSSDNTFTDNAASAGLVQIRGNSVGNVFHGSRLQGQGFRFEAYNDPTMGWTFPHGNVVDGGSIQHADVCFTFVGAYDNHAAHVIVDRCTPVSTSSAGGQESIDNTADLCGDGLVSGDEACDLAALNGAPTTCCTATCTPRASDAICRAAASECDVAETCAGASGACPSDAFKPSGSACTDDGKICSADICDGAGRCAHPPGNAGLICRPSTGPCDVADRCGGSSRNCGADKVQPAGTPCRPAAGACDVAETCNGDSPACPADTLRPADFLCRAAAGACDVAESCTGTSAACPADARKPKGTVCRAAAAACDKAESCDGSSLLCPADAALKDGSSCNDGNACTRTDTCKAGACVGANPVVCTASDACHLPGSCAAQTGTCTNPAKPDGSSCNGTVACLSTRQCIAGRCSNASPAPCEACEICDQSAGCVARPRNDCLVSALPGKAKLALLDSANDKRDSLSWSWSIDHGAAQSDFGNPLLDTSYGLCVFTSGSGTPALLLRTQAPAGGTCDGKPCWRETSTGFSYANGDATPDGTTALKLSRSAAGAAKLKLTGKGVNLLLPPLPLQPGLIVQLQSDAACWSAQMNTPKHNTSKRLRASSD